MAKGWTVQVTTLDRGMRCERVRQQLFDVAIEDKDKAVEAVRNQLRTLADAQVEATEELHPGFPPEPRPGQVPRTRQRCLASRSYLRLRRDAAAWPSHAAPMHSATDRTTLAPAASTRPSRIRWSVSRLKAEKVV